MYPHIYTKRIPSYSQITFRPPDLPIIEPDLHVHVHLYLDEACPLSPSQLFLAHGTLAQKLRLTLRLRPIVVFPTLGLHVSRLAGFDNDLVAVDGSSSAASAAPAGGSQ